MPSTLYGHQSLGTECDRHDHKYQKATEVQRGFVSQHFPRLKKLKKNIQEEMVPKQNCTHVKHISLGFESTNS